MHKDNLHLRLIFFPSMMSTSLATAISDGLFGLAFEVPIPWSTWWLSSQALSTASLGAPRLGVLGEIGGGGLTASAALKPWQTAETAAGEGLSDSREGAVDLLFDKTCTVGH